MKQFDRVNTTLMIFSILRGLTSGGKMLICPEGEHMVIRIKNFHLLGKDRDSLPARSGDILTAQLKVWCKVGASKNVTECSK